MQANLITGAYRLLGALGGRLPPRIAYWLAGVVGWLLYRLPFGTGPRVSLNLRHVLGPNCDESAVQSLVRQACVNIVKGHYELFRLARMSPEQVRSVVHLEGMERTKQMLSEGKGAVVITAHLGNMDVAGQIAYLHGVPMTAVVEHVRPERLFQYVLALRQRMGLRLIPSDGPMLPLFRALRRGELICLACDRDVTGNGRLVSFFGSPTHLPDGAVRVALRTGAPVLPAFVTRLPDNTLVVDVEPPLPLPQTGNPEADIEAGMNLIVALLERRIARHPEQWLVAAPVWPIGSKREGRGA